jgi:hypothetical protein
MKGQTMPAFPRISLLITLLVAAIASGTATIMHDANSTYMAFCAKWFGSGGKVPAYLKQRKDFFVSERIPSLVKMDATVTSQEMVGHSTEGYRSIAAYDAADDYLALAYDLFGLRASSASECPSFTKCADELGLMGE